MDENSLKYLDEKVARGKELKRRMDSIDKHLELIKKYRAEEIRPSSSVYFYIQFIKSRNYSGNYEEIKSDGWGLSTDKLADFLISMVEPQLIKMRDDLKAEFEDL